MRRVACVLALFTFTAYPQEFRASISGEVTLKRFYKEGERVRLQPANSMMSPIYAMSRDVAVQGVVVGLMRRF